MKHILLFTVAAMILSACDTPLTEPPQPQFNKGAAKAKNPTPSFFFASSGSSVIGDGLVAAGDETVYANGICGVQTVVYLDGSGDAVLDMPTRLTGKGCPGLRTLRFNWADASPESLVTRVNVGAAGTAVGTGIYRIAPGASGTMPMNIQTPGSARCTTLKFRHFYLGDPDRPSVGGEDVTVTRSASGNEWHVEGVKAECTRPDGTLEAIELPVAFRIAE